MPTCGCVLWLFLWSANLSINFQLKEMPRIQGLRYKSCVQIEIYTKIKKELTVPFKLTCSCAELSQPSARTIISCAPCAPLPSAQLTLLCAGDGGERGGEGGCCTLSPHPHPPISCYIFRGGGVVRPQIVSGPHTVWVAESGVGEEGQKRRERGEKDKETGGRSQ